VTRILSLIVLASLLVAPVAPLACEVLCGLAPLASVPAACHSEPAAQTSITAADPCVDQAIIDAAFVTPQDRLQQRSPVAALRSHVVPKGAAALTWQPRVDCRSFSSPPRFVLRV
jgi:hypothetical protein